MTFSELARNRYSVRKFKPDPIEEEKLQKILEVGQITPSAHNNRPQRIYVIKSKDVREKLDALSPCTFGAPMILVVAFDRERERQSSMNPGYSFGETDAAIACTHMMLQAWDLGIGSCWVGMFNKQQVAQALNLPPRETVMALLVLGYAADDAKPAPLHTKYRDTEEIITVL